MGGRGGTNAILASLIKTLLQEGPVALVTMVKEPQRLSGIVGVAGGDEGFGWGKGGRDLAELADQMGRDTHLNRIVFAHQFIWLYDGRVSSFI